MKRVITQLIGIVLVFLLLITVAAQAYTSRQASVFRNATSIGYCNKERQRAVLIQGYLRGIQVRPRCILGWRPIAVQVTHG